MRLADFCYAQSISPCLLSYLCTALPRMMCALPRMMCALPRMMCALPMMMCALPRMMCALPRMESKIQIPGFPLLETLGLQVLLL